jgi:hypothetical protein
LDGSVFVYKKIESMTFLWEIHNQYQMEHNLSTTTTTTIGLNTCVGKANYQYFFRCMVSIAIMLTIQATIQLALILDIYFGNGSTKQRADDWFQANHATIAVVVVMAIFLFLNLAALSLIGQLLLFHLRLQRDGLSTYQFIVQDNQRRRELGRKEDDLKLRRQMAIAHAQNENKTWYTCRLKIGGMMREQCNLDCCDPLKLEKEDNDNNNNPKDAEKAPPSATNGLSNNGNGYVLTVTNDTTGPLPEDDDVDNV